MMPTLLPRLSHVPALGCAYPSQVEEQVAPPGGGGRPPPQVSGMAVEGEMRSAAAEAALQRAAHGVGAASDVASAEVSHS